MRILRRLRPRRTLGGGARGAVALLGLLVAVGGGLRLGLWTSGPWYLPQESLPLLLSLNGSRGPAAAAVPTVPTAPATSNASAAAEEVCLTLECLRALGRGLARAFPRRPMASWCVPVAMDPGKALPTMAGGNATADRAPWEGLLYVKVPKAASSTTAGVVLRIRNRTGCRTEHQHRLGHEYATRVRGRSFLLGSVRDPTARALSAALYFVVSPQLEAMRGGGTTTPAPADLTKLALAALDSQRGGTTKGKGGYQYNYLSVRPVPPRFVSAPWEPLRIRQPRRLLAALRRDVMEAYDFLLLVERLEESVVALALLLGLPTLDAVLMAVAAAKATGGGEEEGDSDDENADRSPYLLVRTGRHRGTCQWKRRPRGILADPALARHLASPGWTWTHYADFILHAAANASLDLTIAETFGGRAAFDRQLEAFRRLRRHVLARCGDRIRGTGCTPEGVPVLPMEDCYENDFGCGYKCVDEALLSHDGQGSLL